MVPYGSYSFHNLSHDIRVIALTFRTMLVTSECIADRFCWWHFLYSLMILCYITYKSDCSAECIVQKGSHSFSSTFHVADLTGPAFGYWFWWIYAVRLSVSFWLFCSLHSEHGVPFFPVPVNHTIGVVLHDVDVSQIPVAEPNLTRWPFCRW